WNDLKDPKYQKQLVIPPINNTYGLHTLLMLAKMNGGSEANVDAGFKIIKADVNPNVLAYEPSPGKMTELFQSGQAVLAVWRPGRKALHAGLGDHQRQARGMDQAVESRGRALSHGSAPMGRFGDSSA